MKNKMFLILLIVFVVLTIALAAVLIYFVFFNNSSTNPDSTGVDSNPNHGIVIIPAPDDLYTVDIYNPDGKGESSVSLNLAKDEQGKSGFLLISIKAKYFKAEKAKEDQKIIDNINALLPNIKEAIGTYFQNKTYADVEKSESKATAKEDLKVIMNNILNESEKQKKEIVYEVVFDQWQYQMVK